MNIKTQAAIKTVVFVLTLVLSAVAMTNLLNFLDPTPAQVMYAISAVCFAFMIYVVYSIFVSQAEYKAKLQEMVKE